MSTYRIQDPGQGVIGPVGLDTVIDLVRSGVLQQKTLLARDDGDFEPLSHFPELSDIESVDFSRATERLGRSPDYAGNLGRHTFFKVFYRFHLSAMTGLLELDDGKRHKVVFLEDGIPTFFSSNIRHELFGQFLMRRGLITDDQLETGLEKMRETSLPLGETLVDLGFIDKVLYLNELREQQFERLAELCSWEVGDYRFFNDERYSGARLDLNFKVPELILRAARNIDTALLLKRLEPCLQKIIARKPHRQLDRGDFDFTAEEQQALERIDGTRSIHEILLTFDEKEKMRATVLAVAYLLCEIGAVSLDES